MSYELETPIWEIDDDAVIEEIDSDGDMQIRGSAVHGVLYFDAREVYEMLKDYFGD